MRGKNRIFNKILNIFLCCILIIRPVLLVSAEELMSEVFIDGDMGTVEEYIIEEDDQYNNIEEVSDNVIDGLVEETGDSLPSLYSSKEDYNGNTVLSVRISSKETFKEGTECFLNTLEEKETNSLLNIFSAYIDKRVVDFKPFTLLIKGSDGVEFFPECEVELQYAYEKGIEDYNVYYLCDNNTFKKVKVNKKEAKNEGMGCLEFSLQNSKEYILVALESHSQENEYSEFIVDRNISDIQSDIYGIHDYEDLIEDEAFFEDNLETLDDENWVEETESGSAWDVVSAESEGVESVTEGEEESSEEATSEAMTEPYTQQENIEGESELPEEETESLTEGIEEFETEAETEFETESETESEEIIVEEELRSLEYKGKGFTVTITGLEEAEIPDGAYIRASEILESSRRYTSYKNEAENSLGLESGASSYTRLFNISIFDEENHEVQPKSEVSVSINLLDIPEAADLQVVHFGDTAEAVEVLSQSPESVDFVANSFSVYAIVDIPQPEIADSGWEQFTDLSDVGVYGSEGVLIGISGSGYSFYATGNSYVVNATTGRQGILKTVNCDVNSAVGHGAIRYYFEPVSGKENVYLIYKKGSGNSRTYVKQQDDSLLFVDSADDASEFTVSKSDATHFRIQGSGNYCWNQQGNRTGKGFAAYSNVNDVNAKLNLYHYVPMEDDPFDLDGKTYGFAYLNSTTSATGITSNEFTVSGKSRLRALTMRIRPNIIEGNGILTTSGVDDLAEWTFKNTGEDSYLVSTFVDGVKKFLNISSSGLTLVDDRETDGCTIYVDVDEEGRVLLYNEYGIINYSGTLNQGYLASNNVSNTSWLSLVSKSEELNDDDFKPYIAYKVNLSDVEEVYDGRKVVVYTSIWNSDLLKYEYFVVDSDGTLRKCTNAKDNIQWVGSQVNTALWNFTEYFNDDGTPNYYYELQSDYNGEYMAPQLDSDPDPDVDNSQIFSGDKIGINIPGRRYGDNYSTILSWDENSFAYVGMKAVADDPTVPDSQKTYHLEPGNINESQTFYFAVMDKILEEDELTTVKTLDNNEYGIQMSMIDYNTTEATSAGVREANQTRVLGLDTNGRGLLETYLQENGYPLTVSSVTGKPQTSLYELYNGATPVNHLFIDSVYREGGYFEFDSTQNFAHLNDDGTFTVYDQIATIPRETKASLRHGQFFPYNEIHAGSYADITNTTDVLGNELSDLDPRKGETLYAVPKNVVDHFFGMELSASFVQTESGLDAWGHDIIFEFSGDDDFWLYVDNELVLDIGGVHSASSGSINFRTGIVNLYIRNADGTVQSVRETTLKDILEGNYRSRNPEASDTEVNEYLDGIFDVNDSGQYVFKDFTNHTMKVFYMERGASASNLHMRFNLTSVKKGAVHLTKEVSGVERADFLQAEYPFQIQYKTTADGESAIYTLKEKDDYGNYNVKRAESTHNIKYKSTYVVPGTTLTYNDVFFLKPNETAEIRLPEGATYYRIVECGTNSEIYEGVEINNVETGGTNGDGNMHLDYYSEWIPCEDQKVVYDNKINDNALRTLIITKRLYEAGTNNRIYHADDNSVFGFRLYLGTENDETLSPAYMREYHVKDENMNYCRWDSVSKTFISTGWSNLDGLSSEQLESVTFVTSPNGSIASIPVDYSVEVQDVLVGSKFGLVERENEIPEGYKLRGYEREGTSYIVTNGVDENYGTVRDNSDPVMLVNNERGYGLSVNKVWSDGEFVEEHETIYFAVYANGVLVPGSLKSLTTDKLSLYWYFDELMPNSTFSDYVVKEVKVEGSNITPIENGGEIHIGAKPSGEENLVDYTYTVDYEEGSPTGVALNSRIDTVTNTRDGLRIIKEDLEGDRLAGSIFTLKDTNGVNVSKEFYTSNSNGIVTTAYLPDGDYILSETKATKGYEGIKEDIEISKVDGVITVNGPEGYYSLSLVGNMYELVVKNTKHTIKFVKVDYNGDPLGGAHFAIYRQVIRADGTPRKDYRPIPEYADIVSTSEGLILDGVENFNSGTYYLSEITPPLGFETPAEDACFTISDLGEVSLVNNSNFSLSSEIKNNVLEYTLTAVNKLASRKVRFKKVDSRDPLHTNIEGAVFDIYRVINGDREETPLYANAVSNSNGYLTHEGSIFFELLPGVYQLEETEAPFGYEIRESTVTVTVARTGVTYDEDTLLSLNNSGILYDAETETYTLLITNRSTEIIPPTAVENEPWRKGIPLIVVSFVGLLVFLVYKRKKSL